MLTQAGITATDVEVPVYLVIGAVFADQPIRIGLWSSGASEWMSDLETSSRGDRWIHPLDFASTATLDFEFAESGFTLHCEGTPPFMEDPPRISEP
jgi:hypothetical protein